MSLNTYVRGAIVRVSVIFTDVNGSPVDPTTVTVKYRAPGATATTASPTKDSTGNYHFDIDTTSAAGIWRYGFFGAGTNQAASQAQFTVIPSALD